MVLRKENYFPNLVSLIKICKMDGQVESDLDAAQEQMLERRIELSYQKVVSWFRRNDHLNRIQYDDFVEVNSDKSGNSEEHLKEIETPPFYSESSDSSDHSQNKGDEELATKQQEETSSEQISLISGFFYNVDIINFESPDSFHVIIKNDYDKKFQQLLYRLKEIKEFNRLEPLEQIKRGNLCLLLLNNQLHRAIVQNVYLSHVICYGVDSGKVYVMDRSDHQVYKMTPKIRNTIDFQAINCKLHNVAVPIQPGVNEIIYDMFISKIKNPQIKVMEVMESKLIDDHCKPLKQYDVILMDEVDCTNINQQILDKF